MTKTQVSELYVAIFNRASEKSGNEYWAAKDLTAAEVADEMLATDAAKEYFGSSLDTDQAFIEHIYKNTLNKTIDDDKDGIDYWVSQLADGKSRGDVVSALIDAVATYADSTDPKTQDAYNQFNNRVAVSDDTVENVTSMTAEEASKLSFDVLGVTADAATVDTAKTAVASIGDELRAPTYTITAGQTAVEEGTEMVFTVVASEAFTTKDTTLNYQIKGVEVAGGTADPLDDLGILNGTITIEAGKTSAELKITPISDDNTEGYEGFSIILLDDNFEAMTTSANVVIKDPENAGKNFTLTTGTDDGADFTGGKGNDIYAGVVNGADSTFSALDVLDGGAGTDTLNIGDVAATAAGINLGQATITNIETMNISSINDIDSDAAGTALDTSSVTGLTTLNITKAKDVFVTSATTTDINVSGAANGDKIVDTFTLDLSGTVIKDADTIAFDGVTLTCTDGDVAADVVDDLVTKTYTNWVATDNGDVVTFTAKTSGNKDIDISDFTFTDVGGASTDLTGDVAITASHGLVQSDGGKDVTITDTTAVNDITIGATTVNAGTITVTDAGQGAGVITIDGGTDVTVTTAIDATAAVTGGTVNIGQGGADTDLPTGNVVVTENLTSDAVGGDLTGGAINVKGGSTINVTVNSTTTATTNVSNDIVNGTITVVGDGKTSAVTVTQNSTEVHYSADAIGETYETAVVTFGALKAGEEVFISEGASAGATDLSFVASKDMTAEEVAAAFANLTTGDKQAAGGVVANGFYDNSLDAGWTSGAADGATVTFTATTVGNKTDLVVETDATGSDDDSDNDATNDAAFTIAVTNGSAATTAAVAATTNVVTEGAVNIDDNATAAITTIVVDGYGGTTSDIDGADKLENLTLSNSAAAFTVDTDMTSLTLTLDNISSAADINLDDTGATLTTLNIVTAGTASEADIIATAVETLNVSGTTTLNTSGAGADLDSVKNVTVTGAAGLSMHADDGTKIEKVDASGTSGNVTVSLNTDTAEAASVDAAYVGGTGVDTVSLLTATDIDSTIDLGAGDDTLVLVDQTTAATVAVKGGTGTDTLSMTTATTGTLSMDNITEFERLTINDKADLGTADVTISLDTLGFSYVTTSGTNDTDNGADNFLILDKMATNGTVVLTDTMDNNSAGVKVNVVDAATTDTTLNIVSQTTTADLDVGTLTVADVKAININANDTVADDNANDDLTDDVLDISTLTLVATSAETITVTGNGSITLVNTGNTHVTSIDASALEGDLTVTAAGTTAETITGGAGDDLLTASNDGDTLIGGAGDDTLISLTSTTLTGGAGADTFNVRLVDTVDTAATITDLSSGDTIIISDKANNTGDTAVAFAKLSDANTPDADGNPNLASYANAAIAQSAENGAVWFEYNSNTYIVMEAGNDTSDDFQNGVDNIVKITGSIDLDSASFNMNSGTIEIA